MSGSTVVPSGANNQVPMAKVNVLGPACERQRPSGPSPCILLYLIHFHWHSHEQMNKRLKEKESGPLVVVFSILGTERMVMVASERKIALANCTSQTLRALMNTSAERAKLKHRQQPKLCLHADFESTLTSGE